MKMKKTNTKKKTKKRKLDEERNKLTAICNAILLLCVLLTTVEVVARCGTTAAQSPQGLHAHLMTPHGDLWGRGYQLTAGRYTNYLVTALNFFRSSSSLHHPPPPYVAKAGASGVVGRRLTRHIHKHHGMRCFTQWRGQN